MSTADVEEGKSRPNDVEPVLVIHNHKGLNESHADTLPPVHRPDASVH
jgi:hypothetical protein